MPYGIWLSMATPSPARTTATIALKSRNIQYSLRRARPLKPA